MSYLLQISGGKHYNGGGSEGGKANEERERIMGIQRKDKQMKRGQLCWNKEEVGDSKYVERTEEPKAHFIHNHSRFFWDTPIFSISSSEMWLFLIPSL